VQAAFTGPSPAFPDAVVSEYGQFDMPGALIRECRLPSAKLTRTLERVRQSGVEGIVIFSAGDLSSARLWDAVGAFYSR